jgi:Amt family ammonium transporter|tara:strand:+ start:253 stop:1524 length:1272 start_codon:yes stop_codon:yes gene_type:complete
MENSIIELSYALDTLYFLVMGAFVMWMAAGFTMLESGLVRARNTVEILTKNIALYSISCIMFMIVGYNLMYPGGGSGVIPDLSFFLGTDNTTEEVLKSGGDIYYSGIADHFFQVVFVATACSIISGAVAERMKLWPFLLFCVIMTSFIYPIQGYWKWGGGFLDEAGFLDFAGSGIVHLCGATAALTGVLLLGSRKGKYINGKVQAMPGANLPLATLGTFILWLGWFGFNGGSELMISNVSEANAVSMIFVNTNLAAAGGVMGALIISKLMFGKSDLTMALNGAIAGLVSITAEPLAPTPSLSLLIGTVGGLLVVFSIITLDRMRLDDPVGAISAHGVGGIWGLLAVSLTTGSLGTQIYGTAVIFVWTFITSIIFWYIIKMIFGLRVSESEEDDGVDISECGLDAYPEFTKSHVQAPSVYPSSN